MSSTPPRRHTPPPRYPGTGGRVGHRFGARAIVAIMLVVVLLVASVTWGIVVPGTSTHPQPPQPGSFIVNPTASSAPGSAQPHALLPHSIVPAPTSTVSTAATGASSTTTVDLGNGVSLTPAPGRTIAKPG